MNNMWNQRKLISDYWSLPRETNDPEERVLQELAFDLSPKHKSNTSKELFEKINVDDDWEYRPSGKNT